MCIFIFFLYLLSSIDRVNLRHWTAVEVLEWLSHLELSQYAPAFEGAQIDGAMLRTLSEEDLMVLIPSETDRERLMKHLKDVILENPDGKTD